MKKLQASILILVLCSITYNAQTRPRYSDEQKSSKSLIIKKSLSKTSKDHPNPYRSKSAVGNRVKKTSMVRRRSPNRRMAANTSLQGFSTGNTKVDSFIEDASDIYDVDPLLIFAQMKQESSFKRRARSNKGASGYMQLMPATARRFGVTNIYDPKQNIHAGIKYMRVLLDMFDGDIYLALAGYNAGEGSVIKYGYDIPPYAETQDYVRRITAKYRAVSLIARQRVSEQGRLAEAKKCDQKTDLAKGLNEEMSSSTRVKRESEIDVD